MTSSLAGFMRHVQRRLWTGARGALLAGGLTVGALSLTTSTAIAQSANPFAAAATVNGTVVTNFQVQQRVLFLTLLRSPGVSQEAITDALIDEALQLQAARSAGVTLSPEELEAGIAEFATRTNLEPDALIAALGQEGVAAETLRDFVRNGALWRSLVQQRFGPRAQISEAEVDRALALASERGSARILLSEIALPLTPELSEENEALANRLSDTINSPAAFAAAAQRYSAASTAPRGGRLDWVPLGNLPPQVVGQVLTLAPGEISAPINLGPFIALFLLRDLEELSATPPETLAVEYAEVLIPGGRTETALLAAQDLRDSVDTCEDLYGQDLSGLSPVTRQSVLQSELSQELALELAKLDTHEVSTMLSTDTDLRFIMLCGRSSEIAEGARDQIRGQLRQQRLVSYADGFLDELRADAVIARPQG
ncbi:peptidylprolyl isomerase [Thalassobacter stenotrophicus]|uniref:Parvulin-like PPIase n=2 Tax=Thalassobacter stenotrophicus TaxID=266809 RepID=A0A0P1F0X4_9RHOB|nr:peptidylprolyl isomerase [Thalassobacter stenotrophicus]CUH61101.1 Peptidyl-prolyl cis-trans isomerase SurA [Thalassobacter stenotrophicus]SHI56935.1 periplasmic chaperone for outer membrane proteins SurA [Thalassobacter stenotrophicus DSM 16310]